MVIHRQTDIKIYIIRINHECEGRIENSRGSPFGITKLADFLSYPHMNNGFFFFAHHCFYLIIYIFIYLFQNKLPEVIEYTKMQFHMMTLLDVLGKIALVR